MEILNAFVLEGTSYTVRILLENEQPLYQASDIAKVLGIRNIRSSISSFDDDEKVTHLVESASGDQNTTFLTEGGMYRLLMRSKKERAKPFQKWLSQVVISIRKKGRYELEQRVHAAEVEVERIGLALQEERRRGRVIIERSNHRALLEAFKGPGRYLVYFGKIREEQGKTLVKIGSTQNIQLRAASLADDFGSIYMFEVLECAANTQFERFLQKHPRIVAFVHTDPVHHARRSNGEVFLMSDEDISTALAIAKRNVHKFRTDDTAVVDSEMELRQELDQSAYEIESLRLQRDQLQQQVLQVQPAIVTVVNKERRFTQARGPKVQRYSADGRVLLDTYVGFMDAARDVKVDNPTPLGIKTAIASQAVYKGYRWASLDRTLPDETVQQIGETAAVSMIRTGLVAMLDLNKSKIVSVFCNQSAAAEDRKFKGVAAISAAIQRGTKSGGHYFQMWFDCSEELQQEYLTRAALPEPHCRDRSKAVLQIHPTSGATVRRFSSVSHVLKEHHLSRASLYKAIECNWTAGGYKWQFAEDA